MGRLVGSQIRKHNEKTHSCKMCFSSFHSEEKLKDHKTYCSARKSVKIEMPKSYDNILQFKNYNHSLKVPFTVYDDFECMLQKIQICQPSDEIFYSNAYQKDAPNNFAYYVKYCSEDYKPPEEYPGMAAPKIFYEKLKKDALQIAKEYYENIKPMGRLTEKEKIN